MRHGRRAGAAARADKGDGAADERRFRVVEQGGDGFDQRQGRDRSHQVFRHALADQFAIQRNVVVGADHHHLGGGVAHFGQLSQLIEQVASARRAFDDDQGRSRLVLVDVYGFEDAAAADLALGARHAPVERGGIAGLEGLFAVREKVDGDTRDRDDADVFVGDEGAGTDPGATEPGGRRRFDMAEGSGGRRAGQSARMRGGEGLALDRRGLQFVFVGERIAHQFGRFRERRGERFVQIVGFRSERIGRRLALRTVIGDEFVLDIVEVVEGIRMLWRGRHGVP